MSNLLKKSANISFVLQIITGVIDIIALQVEIPKEDDILKQLLFLELIVQIIEGVFYYWLISSIHSVKDITSYRYYDWLFTTPIMLYTLMMYLCYLNPENKGKKLQDLYNEHKSIIITVVFLNFLMLYFGYLGEIGKISIKKSVYLGFIPFLLYYKIIYDNFVKPLIATINNESNKKQGLLLFWYFFIFWSLYGIAALMPYTSKNISYNILDLFSKNFFGVFLSYVVYKKRIQ